MPYGAPAPVAAMLMVLVRVMPPESHKAAPVVAVPGLRMTCPEPSALALLIWMTPLTIVVVPLRPLLLAVTINVPRSFF